jgi:threonine aldolase
MLDFVNDYSEGAHEKILQRLLETNMEKLSGYGTDQYCESAKQKIREACECPEADIYFLVGGTQTNATVIDALLEQYEGVVSADTDISVHMRQEQLKHPPIKCWQFRIRTGKLLQKP